MIQGIAVVDQNAYEPCFEIFCFFQFAYVLIGVENGLLHHVRHIFLVGKEPPGNLQHRLLISFHQPDKAFCITAYCPLNQ